jgi:hypothetical protein
LQVDLAIFNLQSAICNPEIAMSPIPLYLKTDADMPRPADPEFYWMTRNGVFLCRNHPFFTSDVPSKRPIKALGAHEPHCVVRYPLVKASTLEHVVSFFARVHELHQSESVVLLMWDLDHQRYKILVPPQEATVWQSYSGRRSPEDVRYAIPVPLPDRHLLVGDIHCHGNMAAFASLTDADDERYRDGIHAVVGRIDREPPEFHIELAIDGFRFSLKMDQIFEGYRQRRKYVPKKWLDQVKIKMDGPLVSFGPSKVYHDDWWTVRPKNSI